MKVFLLKMNYEKTDKDRGYILILIKKMGAVNLYELTYKIKGCIKVKIELSIDDVNDYKNFRKAYKKVKHNYSFHGILINDFEFELMNGKVTIKNGLTNIRIDQKDTLSIFKIINEDMKDEL